MRNNLFYEIFVKC